MAGSKQKREGFYTIGVVARMYDIHPQTLRLYEKRGLLTPHRTGGNTRLYSQRDVEVLEFILTLTNELHVNVAGVEIIVQLRQRIEELQRRLMDLGQRMEAAESSVAMGPDCTKMVRVPPVRPAPLREEMGPGPVERAPRRRRSR